MDVWIVAAAAGAGYVAQRFKKLTMGAKRNCPDLSSENLEIAPEPPESLGDEMCRQRGHAFLGASFPLEIASTSGSQGGNGVFLDNFGSSNYEDSQGDEDVTSDSIEVSYGIRRNGSGLRSRRVKSRFVRPQNSLESCLMAQLYKENSEMEEYTYSVRAPTVRPFLVYDGSRIISRGPHQSYSSKQTGTGNNELGKDRTEHCVPRLPNVVPEELQTNAKAKTGKEHVLSSSNTGEILNGYQNNSRGSSADGSLLFHLGLTMGITYSSLRHKLETEKLRKSLKHTEDLIQDLQEELEMKDASTVKELAVEDYEESLDVHNDSYFNDDAMQALSPEQKLDSSPRHCNDKYRGRKGEEESMRKIEAELEAELDRLESNMNSSNLGRKQSDVSELDTDFVSDVIAGDLRADLFGAKTSTQQTYGDRDVSSSSTTTTRSVHYAVSPRELTSRLHQLIQSRLEERVRELETALEQSQAKNKCTADFSNLKMENSSNHESPIAAVVDQPVVINLSGEALSAYNEAYEELTKLSESDEEESERGADFGLLEGCVEQHLILNGSPKTGFSSGQEEDARMNPSNDVSCNSSEDGEDEMEKLLIQQIVEKARQGSPAVLKVQRALLSSDENYIWNKMEAERIEY